MTPLFHLGNNVIYNPSDRHRDSPKHYLIVV
jgi:hypothetical protein